MAEHESLTPFDLQVLRTWDDDLRVAVAEEEWGVVGALLESAPSGADGLPRFWIGRARLLEQRGELVEARECVSEARWRFPANPFIESMERALQSARADEVPPSEPTPVTAVDQGVALQEAYIEVIEVNRQLQQTVTDLQVALAAARQEVAELQRQLAAQGASDSHRGGVSADIRQEAERLQEAVTRLVAELGRRDQSS